MGSWNITSALFLVTLAYSALIQAFLREQEVYYRLQVGLYLLVLLLIVHLFASRNFKVGHPVIAYMGLVVLGSQAARGLVSLAFGADVIARDVLLLPLVMVVLGFNSSGGQRQTSSMAYVYGASSAIAGWWVVVVYGSDTAYAGQYFFAQKNQIGAVIGAACALLLYGFVQALSRQAVSLFRVAALAVLLVLNLLPLLALRNRSTIVGLLLLLFLVSLKVLFHSSTGRAARLVFAGIWLLAAVFARELSAAVNAALFTNFDTEDVNNVSANRVQGYADALVVIRDNPLLGRLLSAPADYNPHNFVLYQVWMYGLVLSAGYLAVYFAFGARLLRAWPTTPLAHVPPWAYLLTISFVTSMTEYAQPFGPGTTQIAAWYFVGQGLSTFEPLEGSD